MVIVAVVNEHTLLHNDLLFRVASVEDTERAVRKTVNATQWTERTRMSVSRLSVQHQNVYSDAQVVLDPVIDERQVGGGRDETDAVGSAVGDVDLLDSG